jgi:hypothetical protein
MRTVKPVIATLLLLVLCQTSGQSGERSVLLPAREAKAVSKWYSKDRAEKIDGTWEPSKTDLDELEANLSQISTLNIYGWDLRIHIEHPEQYFRQYIAVKVSGQNRIFVNSFRDETPPSDWHDKLYVVTDGATCCWQALYDPATKLFSNLRIDARA